MFQSILRGCSLLLIAVVVCSAQSQELIPFSRLRPADGSRFFPELVRLQESDIDEIRSVLVERKQPDMAAALNKQLLRKLPMDAPLFARLLGARSEPLQEWTLRTLGEYRGEKTATVPALLNIIADPRHGDAHRALAIRVLGTTPMNSDAVSLLVHQLPGASTELRVIVLEAIATSGGAGRAFIPELKHYLSASEASVQFHAFRAIQQMDKTSGAEHGGEDEAYATAQQLWRAGTAESGLAKRVLNQTSPPKYLTCVALLNAGSDATALVLRETGNADRFISELAANVLKRVGIGEQSVAALTEALSSDNASVRLNALQRLRQIGPAATTETDALVALLHRAATTGATVEEVGACLDLLRGMGANAKAAQVLVQLLDEKSPVYKDAEKHVIHDLRGFIFATMAETGVPTSALPFIASALANSDERSAVEFAGAARAAAMLGAPARECAAYLVRAITERLDQDFISFNTFGSHGSASGEYTTCQVEALRALRAIGAGDETTVRALRAFLEQPGIALDGTNLFRRIPNLQVEAGKTLAAIEAKHVD